MVGTCLPLLPNPCRGQGSQLEAWPHPQSLSWMLEQLWGLAWGQRLSLGSGLRGPQAPGFALYPLGVEKLLQLVSEQGHLA